MQRSVSVAAEAVGYLSTACPSLRLPPTTYLPWWEQPITMNLEREVDALPLLLYLKTRLRMRSCRSLLEIVNKRE
eukprot:scaffold390_cov149-Skeletonema_menzelii.AAC.5